MMPSTKELFNKMFVELISFTFVSISGKQFLLLLHFFKGGILSLKHSSGGKKKTEQSIFLFYSSNVGVGFFATYHSILEKE